MSFLTSSPAAIGLGVNIDHVATLRNARGTVYPDPLAAARMAEEAGADLITLHVREDRRHIRDEDARALKRLLLTRMNLECAVTDEMIDFACALKPEDVCLVPERRAEVTTEGGLDVVEGLARVRSAVERLSEAGIRVGLFIDPDWAQIEASREVGAAVVEFHTGRYADATAPGEAQAERERIVRAVDRALAVGLIANAGHGLNLGNVAPIAAIPGITELNIGHALIAQAVFVGLDRAVRDMKASMIAARLQSLGLASPS